MFDWLYNLLGSMLAWFNSWTGSYAVSLLFYALIFKIVFLPFAIKQQKNQIKMAKLTPKIELIKAKYRGRNDQATMRKQQEEIMALQQKEGYSPLAGCLPLLLQLPIIIILYNVIRSPLSYLVKLSSDQVIALNNLLPNPATEFKSIDQISLIDGIKNYINTYGAGKIEEITAGKITNIAGLPNLDIFGINLGPQPGFNPLTWAVIIPFLAAGFQWLTMWITRKLSGNANALVNDEAAQQTQMSMKILDLIMPLMTLWIAFSFSGMMGLYWIFQSILAIIQTVIINLAMPLPRFTEEELKAMRKAQKAQAKAQQAIIKTQPKYRSLHYIDEDDYEELPEIKNNTPKDTKNISGDKPEIKD